MKLVKNKLRVTHLPQIPCKGFVVEVKNEREAYLIEQTLANQHLFLFDNNFIPDYSNIILVEMWDEDMEADENGEKWCDYYNEEELDIAERRLELLLNNQAEYKEINAEIRKCKILDHYELLKYLKEMGYDLEALKEIRQQGGRYKVPAFVLTNNNATIKRTSQKVIVMTNRIERKSSWQDITFDGGYATIADDRVKVFHDEKPSKEVITEIKSNGFRWSPHWKCWCRKHTGNAIYALKQLSFIKNKI